MDLRVYYQRIRDMQQTIGDSFAVVVSRETPDGGKPGVKSEVPRDLAARMIVDGRARLASEEEAQKAVEALNCLPDSSFKDALIRLAEFSVERSY